MNNIDTLISANFVLPIIPRNTILQDHSLALKDGKIVDILPTASAKTKYQAKESLLLSKHILMPGLVNSHTHAAMTLFRSLVDDLPLLEWLQKHMWPAEEGVINEETIRLGTELAMAEMLRGGVTCFNDMYFFPIAATKAVIEAGMRSIQGLVIMSVPTNYAKTESEYLQKTRAICSSDPGSDLVTWMIAPHGSYTNSDASLQEAKMLADKFNLRIHVHAHETLGEIKIDVDRYGKRCLKRLDEAGLISEKTALIHMVHVTADEIALVKERKAHVVHCPESNMRLGSGFSNQNAHVKNGVNLALGTDGAAANDNLDILGEMRSATFMAKGLANDPTVFPPAQVLEMATLNGAKALGLDSKIGTLEKGKDADVTAIDLSHYFTQPTYNIPSLLVYAVSRMQVTDVWVKGRRLLEKGELKTIDIEKTLAEISKWSEKIKKYG